MQKSRNAKKGRNTKNKAENAFKFRNSYKKIKNGKKKAHLFGFFRFYIPCAFFCILNLKIRIKKTKMQKKSYNFFSNSQNTYAKKQKIIFQKKMQKKAEMQKSRGCN